MVAWIVERYLPEATREEVDAAATHLAAATLALSARGVAIRYLGSTFVAAEEYCVCRFEGESADDVRRACELAGVSYARIVEAQELPPTPLVTEGRKE
jgi:Protein of unknown function (DUF4242)